MAVPPSQDPDARSYSTPPKRRRRFSIWTLLAPAAVLVLWVSFFSAVGKSCIVRTCEERPAAATDATTDASGDKRNTLDQGAKYKIKAGDSLGAIAARYDLTEDELKACNPTVDPQTIQPGDRLLVSAIDCEEADKAETGANPDPLAGETTGTDPDAVPDPSDNGTAAADPSATKKDAEG